jgi:hypothetical protein
VIAAAALLVATQINSASSSDPPSGHSPEAQAIVLEALRYEALRERGWPICVRLTSWGVPFDWPAGNGGTGWITPPAKPPAASLEFQRGPQVVGAELTAAATQAIAAPPPAAPAMVIERPRLPARLRSEDPNCADIYYSVPAVVGDIAFVQITFDCGPLCAEGWRYALKRRGGRWSLFAVNFLWIS